MGVFKTKDPQQFVSCNQRRSVSQATQPVAEVIQQMEVQLSSSAFLEISGDIWSSEDETIEHISYDL
jgi:hypothetical protein